jgi:hypothetical protein
MTRCQGSHGLGLVPGNGALAQGRRPIISYLLLSGWLYSDSPDDVQPRDRRLSPHRSEARTEYCGGLLSGISIDEHA